MTKGDVLVLDAPYSALVSRRASTAGHIGLSLILAVMLTLSADAYGAAAQVYPSKPIRLVVASAPGGGNDFVARAINAKLAEFLDKNVVIDNRGGAAGLLAAQIIAQAPADGHTLLQINTNNFVMLPSIHKKLPFDVIRDFAPVASVAFYPLMLVVNPSLPATSVSQLIEFARARKGAMNFASSGVGSFGHLTGELFKSMAKVQMGHVPYKGGGPIMIAVASNEVELFFSALPTAMAQVKAGRLRSLGVTSAKRSSTAPQVPTIAEQGVPNFEALDWIGMFAPAATPAAVVNLLNAIVNKSLALAETKEYLLTSGVEPGGGTPEQFSDQLKRDMKKWGAIATQAGVKAE